MPDEGARRSILGIHVRGKPLAGGVDLDALARLAEGMSGAEIEGAVDRAAVAALRRHIRGAGPPDYKDIRITHGDLDGAIREGGGRPAAAAPKSAGSGPEAPAVPAAG